MKKLTPLKAIRAKCLECSNGKPKEVRLCPGTDCMHYPFRFGKNPHRKGIGSCKIPKNRKLTRNKKYS